MANARPPTFLAEDCTFSSPVVFQPAEGVFQASRYLDAAYRGFAQLPPLGEEPAPGGFRDLRETRSGPSSAELCQAGLRAPRHSEEER